MDYFYSFIKRDDEFLDLFYDAPEFTEIESEKHLEFPPETLQPKGSACLDLTADSDDEDEPKIAKSNNLIDLTASSDSESLDDLDNRVDGSESPKKLRLAREDNLKVQTFIPGKDDPKNLRSSGIDDLEKRWNKIYKKSNFKTGVYFIKPVGKDTPIKIGFSRRSVVGRLRGLQTGSPDRRLCIYSVLDVNVKSLEFCEDTLHRVFAVRRTHGEWLDITTKELDAFFEIREVRKQILQDVDNEYGFSISRRYYL